MAKLRHERICQVNNNHKYSYCPYCSEYASLPSWMIGFCSSNCRNIYNIVQDSKVGYISMDEAYEKLMECDLSEEDQFADYIKEQIAVIRDAKNAMKVEEPPIEEPPVEEPQPEVAHDEIDPEVEEPKVAKKAVTKHTSKKAIKTVSK